MTEFVRFEEANDHEGETWNFWLQLDGNEAELDKLAAALKAWEKRTDSECEYQLFLEEPVSESEVDILVKHSRSGYMRFENKDHREAGRAGGSARPARRRPVRRLV